MSELTPADIKCFFRSLSGKERCAIVSRGIMVALCLILISFLAAEIRLNGCEAFVSSFFLIGGAFFFPPVLFLFFYWPFFLLLLTDFHLFRSYGLSVSGIGKQVAAVIVDTNKTEVFEYLAGAGIWEWLFLLMIAGCSLAVPFFKPDWKVLRSKWRGIVLLGFCMTYPFGYISHACPAIRSVFAGAKNEIPAKTASFRFNPRSGNKADTVVILIGESHRQAEFYPAFEKYASKFRNLYRFSDMTSPFAGTLNTVPIILSRKKATDYFDFFYEKSLFSLFKEAGYSTYFVHYINTTLELNGLSFIYNEADHFIKYVDKITPATDENILPVLSGILAGREKKKLIVIKMIGAHRNFSERYPDPDYSPFRRFITSVIPKTKEREMLHYNKAISYSAEVIADIMETVEHYAKPSLLLFSSDHGICIFDKGTFHIPPDCQNAFHIPAMILLNPALSAKTSKTMKRNLACNEDKPLTEEYYFETVASLAGISYPAADKRYDLTKRCNPLRGKKRPVYVAGKTTFYEDL